MKKEFLNALGINVSKDISPRELLNLNNNELFNNETAGKVAALKEICQELYGKRNDDTHKVIANSLDAVSVLAPVLRFLDHEECWMITVNQMNAVIDKHQVSSGGLTTCDFDIRRLARFALIDNCTGVVFAHNHPSGSTVPSKADIKETKKVRDALKLFNINLLDHIIISDSKYFSLAEESTYEIPVGKMARE